MHLKTVYIFGSDGIERLNENTKEQINSFCQRDFLIYIGNNSGFDICVQKYLSDKGYPYVVVCSADTAPLYGLKCWDVVTDVTDSSLSRIPASIDYALTAWDGGTGKIKDGITAFLKAHKSVILSIYEDDSCHCITSQAQFKSICRKIRKAKKSELSIYSVPA